MIDNTRLTKSQKLQHLKPSLTGDADKLLHSIKITDQKNFVKNPDTATQQTSAKVKTDDKKFTGAATFEKSQDEVFLQTAIISLEINGEIFHTRGVLDSA